MPEKIVKGQLKLPLYNVAHVEKLRDTSQSTLSGSRIRGLHAPFTGSEIISILSMPQGPEVGEVFQLLKICLCSGPVSNQDALDLAEWERVKIIKEKIMLLLALN